MAIDHTVSGQKALDRLRHDDLMGTPAGSGFGKGVAGGPKGTGGGDPGKPISKDVTPNADGLKGGTPWTNQHGTSDPRRRM